MAVPSSAGLGSITTRRAMLEWSAVAIVLIVILLRLRLWTMGVETFKTILPEHDGHPATDFFQDWGAARDQMAGLGMYQPLGETFRRNIGSLGPGAWEFNSTVKLNGHPPSMILFVMPLALLPYLTAFRIWSLFGLLSIFASLRLLIGSLWPARSGLARTAIAALSTALLLTSAPIDVQFKLGNIQAILLLVLTLVFVNDRAGRPLLAGLFLGVAAATKFYPMLLVLYFALRKDWRAIGMTVAVFCGIQLISLAAFGRSAFDDYVRAAVPNVSESGGYNADISLAGYWTKLFHMTGGSPETVRIVENPLVARAGRLLSSAAILGALILTWWRHGTEGRSPLLFGAVFMAMLLLAPVMWGHGLVLAIVPLAILIRYVPSPSVSLWVLRGIVVLYWLPAVFLLKLRLTRFFPDVETYQPAEVLTYASIYFYSLLVLLAMFLMMIASPPTPLPDPRIDEGVGGTSP